MYMYTTSMYPVERPEQDEHGVERGAVVGPNLLIHPRVLHHVHLEEQEEAEAEAYYADRKDLSWTALHEGLESRMCKCGRSFTYHETGDLQRGRSACR